MADATGSPPLGPSFDTTAAASFIASSCLNFIADCFFQHPIRCVLNKEGETSNLTAFFLDRLLKYAVVGLEGGWRKTKLSMLDSVTKATTLLLVKDEENLFD